MTARQAGPRNALEPPTPPNGHTVVVATDLDRTFTRPDLQLSPEALRSARLLRSNGVRVILVTGRPAQQIPLTKLQTFFDAMVLEGGAVWGRPGRWTMPGPAAALWTAADAAKKAGHQIEEAWASFSAPASAASEISTAKGISVHQNGDRIDVTSEGVDKATGLLNVLREIRIDNPWILGVGDSLNDLPLAKISHSFVAVANAHEDLARAATMVAPHEAAKGFVWAVRGLSGVHA